jgi:phosphate transport system ATP-binding protein
MTAPKIQTHDLDLYYGDFQALIKVNIAVRPYQTTALIGPSGCGKSTLLRTFNRMNDLIDGVRIEGQVIVGGQDIYGSDVDLADLRKRVGMVFQRPNPFPLSIYENIAFGPKIHGVGKDQNLKEVVERCLEAVLLWDDLKDKLHTSALALSLEQQQRLCIARALAVMPDILLMDEPCSALDPVATQRIEDLIQKLEENYTIVIVTHNMQQAARVSEECGFMLLGELVEFGDTSKVFTAPDDPRTEDYVTGRYG